MLALTKKKRKVSIAIAVFLLVSIFLAFSVVGDEGASGDFSEGSVGDVVEEQPAQGVVEESLVEEDVRKPVEDLSVDLGEDSVEADSAQEAVEESVEKGAGEMEVEAEEDVGGEGEKEQNESEELYVDLDEVLEDRGIEDVANVSDKEVFIDLSHVESSGESLDSPGEEKEGGGKEKEGVEEKRLAKRIVKDGKEVMSLTYFKNESEIVENIRVKEKVVEESEKAIRKELEISSNDHFTNEIFYSYYLDREVEDEGQIEINWKSEGEEIDFDVFDENDNGLIDKVSWKIPHLSVQEFEIIINFDVQSNWSSFIGLEVVEAPEGNVSSGEVEFDFDVSYYNASLVLCNFSLIKEGDVMLSREDNGGLSSLNVSLGNGEYVWQIVCFDFENESINNGTNGNFFVGLDYNPIVTLDADVINIEAGESVEFDINVSVPYGSLTYITYNLSFGDGDFVQGATYESGGEQIDTKSHEYDSAGTFDAILVGKARYEGGGTFYASDEVEVTVSEPPPEGDIEGPDIELIEPDDGEYFELEDREEKIKFSFNVSDEGKISNCTFEMFYYNDSIFGEEVVTEFKKNLENGKVVSYEYKDFDEGDYSWDVECYDNASNRGGVSDRDFYVEYEGEEDSDSGDEETVALSAEEQEDVDEVQELIDAINEFFVEEERFGPDQTDAIEDLELDDTLKFYKKKLLQMKLDLQHNLNYIDEDERRDERRDEILEEIEQIRREIPISFEVLESHEYFKNSLELDFEEVMGVYAEAKGLVVNDRVVREMAKRNELLQNQIAVSSVARKVNIEYYDERDENYVLVTKEIDFKSKDFDSIFEVIPEDVVSYAESVSFIVEGSVLRAEGPVIEINLGDLDDRDKLVYKVYGGLSALNDIEKTTTLAFKEDIPESTIGPVSGFVSFVGEAGDGGIWFYLSWVLAIGGLVAVSTYSYRRVRIARLRKHRDVRALFAVTSETEKLLKRKEIEKAREKYHEAKALYPKIPDHGKRFAYRKLQKLYLAIDKKDIVSMVKEFIEASKAGRKADALMLYGDIQKLYPRMPSGFKQKVFEKMQPHLDRLKWMK